MQPQPTPNQRDADTEHLRTLLLDLADLGASLARQVHAQAMAQAAIIPEANAPESTRDATAARTATLTAAFDRVARCVRRTALLVQHLHDAPKPEAPNKASDPATERRTQARTRILRECEHAIDRAVFNRRADRDPAAIRRELLERLDDPGLDGDLAHRPLPEIIAGLREDLGVSSQMPFTCPTRRRTPEEVRALRAEAAAPPGTLPTLPPRPFPPLPPPRPSRDMKEMMALCAALAPAPARPASLTPTATAPPRGTAPPPQPA